ncbi:MAG: hypothetical protein V9H69_17895 [Anaerolineae bacterium]
MPHQRVGSHHQRRIADLIEALDPEQQRGRLGREVAWAAGPRAELRQIDHVGRQDRLQAQWLEGGGDGLGRDEQGVDRPEQRLHGPALGGHESLGPCRRGSWPPQADGAAAAPKLMASMGR